MKIFLDRIQVQTSKSAEFLDVTDKVLEVLKKAGIRNGFVNIMPLHTTTSVYLGELGGVLVDDVKAFLERLVASYDWYRHNSAEFSDCERRNAASHIRALLLGSNTLTLQVCKGELILGEHQRIIFAELDGPRTRRTLQIQAVGEVGE